MRLKIPIAIKKRVQNLEEVDIRRAFDEHCVIQTNRWTGFVFRTSVKDPANFKEGLPAPRESLKKKAGCAKWREGV